jgi:hypothetical protein
MAGGADATAELEVLVQIRDAVSNLQTVSREAKTQSDAMTKSFDAIKIAAGAAVAVFASKQVLDFFASGIEAANAQQVSMQGLATQLRLTGDYSSAAMKNFADFADEMERTTNVGDDVILQQVGIAKSFGVSNAEAEKMVRAALDLSKATGKELEPTLRALGGSLSGVTGPLGKQLDVVKSLTKEQLAHGAAIDEVLKRYGGTAAASIQTFSGAMEGAQNAFGNFQEAFGKVIVENPALMTAVQEIGNAFNILTDAVGDNESALSDLVTGGINVVTATIGASLDMFVLFVGAIKAVQDGADTAQVALLGMASLIPGFEESATAVAKKVIDANEASDTWLDSIGERGAAASLKFQEISEKIAGAAKVEQGAASDTVKASNTRRDAYKDETKAADELAKRAKAMGPNIDQGELIKRRKDAMQVGPPISEEQRKAIEAEQKKLDDQAKEQQAERNQMFSTIGSLVSAGSGRQSAMQAGQLLGSAVADAFVPGLGQAVGPILGVLMQGEEATKAFIQDFIAAIPDIVDALAASAPVVVEALVDSLINDGGAVRIAVSLTKAMAGEAIWMAIGEKIGVELGDKFNIKEPAWLQDFIDSVESLTGDKVAGKVKATDDITMGRVIVGVTTGGTSETSGAGTAVQELADATGFGLTGGFSPPNTGRPGMDMGAVDYQLADAAAHQAYQDAAESAGYGYGGYRANRADQGKSDSEIIAAYLAKVFKKVEEPQTVKAVVKLDAKAFADITLELKRRNARLF